MKRSTIKWYTGEDVYMGWNYFDKVSILAIQNWIRSGNYVIQGSRKFNGLTAINLIKREEK